MRVFVLSTGRCGSVSFAEACSYIDNYSSGHETLCSELGQKRFEYPDNHIEADNRLSWHLGELDRLFGDDAYYVHLLRDRDKVANSYNKRYRKQGGIIKAYCEGVKMTPVWRLNQKERLQMSYDYVDTVTDNIICFLTNKSNKQTIHLEQIDEGFEIFWNRIGAEGDYVSAANVFNQPRNESTTRLKKWIRYFTTMNAKG